MTKFEEELYELAFQEGKSVLECLKDIYNKGKEDGSSELVSELRKEFYFNSIGDLFLHISKSHLEYIVEHLKERMKDA